MRSRKQARKRSYALCALAASIALAVTALPCAAAEAVPVRVGYFDCGVYYQPQPDGSVESYDTAYLEALAEYSGLAFAYVDCGTWENALQMLERKEIDLLGTMQRSAEREAQYALCQSSYGVTAAELVTLPGSGIGYEDYAAIGQARLGVLRNYVRQPELEALLAEHAITPHIQYYDTQEALLAALADGSVDVVAANSHTLSSEYAVVAKFSYHKIYFASWRGNERLATQLDRALIEVQLYRPNLQAQLQTQYFSALMQEPYSVEELAYIAGVPELNVYINAGSAPLAYLDDEGRMTGILVELCDMIQAETGLRFHYRPLADADEPVGSDFLTVNAPDASMAGQAFVSDSFFTADFNLYCRTGQPFEPDPSGAYRVVLPRNRQSFIDYLMATYPNCEIIKLDTPEECLQAVCDGQADLTMLSSYLVENLCKRRNIQTIISIPSQGVTQGFTMIAEGPDAEKLTNILNKGIARLDEKKKNDILFAYALNTHPDITLSYFVQHNAVLVIVSAVILAGAICAFIYAHLLARKNATIKKANSARSVFLSTMSHDIRTPMNAIINIAKLAQDDYASGGNVLEDLRQIGTVSDYLMALLNDVLDMSSIERGKLQLHPEVYSYEEFLHYIRTVFEPLCNDKKIRFVCEADSTHLPVLVDKVRFNQVFSNLLSNAVKYTPEGGTVTFRVTDNAVKDGALHCQFEVTDTGCGMSEAFLSRVFEPFERENATRTAYQGTGLGLSIAKSIVTLMGGSISVKSVQGKGTSFSIQLTLPLATENQQLAAAQTPGTDTPIEGAQVLVVEDNETNIIVLTRFLAKKGVVCTVARDGTEGVEAFERAEPGSFDLILMDLRMPVMDGLEATRRIRAMDRPDAASIPILAMTADALENDVEATRAAGMNAHLTKPVVAETLYRVVGQYCKGRLPESGEG